MYCGKRSGRSEGGEEYTDVGDLLATQGHSDIQAQAADKGHVWVQAGGYVAIYGPCCHQRIQGCPLSGAATGGHVDIQEECHL